MGTKRSHTYALMLAFAAVLALCLATALTSGAAAAGGDDGFDLSVTQCDDSAPDSDPAACTETTQTLAPKPKKKPQSTTQVITVAPSKPKPAEVHDVVLATGSDEVKTLAGDKKKDAVDVSATVEKQLKEDPDPADLGAQTLPDVKTNAGSPFAGFGAGFDFVSGDEALARFAVPPFLEPIYYAAGQAYGVPWNVLAAINSIETDFGRIEHQVSSAGALGWMQFMPGTWKRYGVDATGDGVADPWNPVDAIYAAARYLKASGADTDLRKAILAYNHADWYADSVLRTASVYGSLPAGLVAETGSLAYGRFPLRGSVAYGDDFRAAQQAGERPDGLVIRGAKGAAAIATQEVTVKRILLAPSLARTLTRERSLPELGLKIGRPAPAAPAAPPVALPLPDPTTLSTAGSIIQTITHLPLAAPANELAKTVATASAARLAHASHAKSAPAKRPTARTASLPDGYGRSQTRGITVVVEDAFGNSYSYAGLARLRSGLHPGSKLSGGNTVGTLSQRKPELLFGVRAAGGAPVDPRPLVDGYRLQEAAGFYHVTQALGGNPFVPTLSAISSPGGSINGSDAELSRRVLDDPGIQIYPCGRADIEHGTIDRRVLGALLYLRKAGLTLTITSLHCGHGYYTAGGNVSAHSYGAAVDIAAFNGQPVLGHQGPGSLTAQAIQLLMQLQGDAQPAQLISLMNMGGPSFAMADHDDHLHVGYHFQQALGLGRTGDALGQVNFKGGGSFLGGISAGKVDKATEAKFSKKLGGIRNPLVRRGHGTGSVKVEAEDPQDAASARKLALRNVPLRAVSTAMGASVIAVDVPSSAKATEAYAIGRVAGAGRAGWAPRQIVVLRNGASGWTVVGPPRDAKGKIANPSLTALATVRGGAGYAVGESGALVLLRGDRAPVVLRSGTKRALQSVDASRVGRRLMGYAAGTRRTGVALAGRRASVERTGATLDAVLTQRDGGVVALASKAGASPELYRRAHSWSHEAIDFNLPAGSSVRLTALTEGSDGLWLAGGLSDVRTIGHAAEMPFAAQQTAGGWKTWCAGAPALAPVRELGTQSERACAGRLTIGPVALGPATDIARTAKGVVVATPAGLQILHDSNDFRLVPDVSSPPTSALGSGPAHSKLSISSGGLGWAVGNGRLSRITPATGNTATSSGTSDALSLPVAGGGDNLRLSVAYGGRHALAISGGDARAFVVSRWGQPARSGLGFSDVAWLGDATAWALEANTGYLVRYSGNTWSVPGAGKLEAGLRKRVLDALGGSSLLAGGSAHVAPGLRALAIGRTGEGFAVGMNGQIARFSNGAWSRADSPTKTLLRTVAVGTRAVAAGDGGTLLERDGKSWARRADVSGLVSGQSLTAVDVMRDGTALAAGAYGAVLQQRAAKKAWTAAPLQPLGMKVAKLRGYRAADGTLRVLALVRGTGSSALLVGDARGWRSIGERLGAAVADFELDRATGRLWIAGVRQGNAVTARMRLNGATWVAEGTKRKA